MKKFKVFMPSGTIQTVIASFWKLEWSEVKGGGVLRFYREGSDEPFAIFPPGGWHGIQDMEVYKKESV